MKRNGEFDTILIEPSANPTLAKNRNEHALYDNHDFDKWNQLTTNGKKV